MLFDEDKEGFGKEAIAKLKEKARKVADLLKSMKEENDALSRELERLKSENEGMKKKLEFFESERVELSSLVKELIEEFEHAGNEV